MGLRARITYWPCALARWIERRLRGGTKRVLLVTSSELSTAHLGRFLAAMGETPGLEFSAVAVGDQRDRGISRPLVDRGARGMSRRATQLCDWDLVVHATAIAHLDGWSRPLPLMYVRHGSSGGKAEDGEDYAYASRFNRWPDGSLIYDIIFESSAEERLRVLERSPDLAGVITVVGSLQHDDLLRRVADREQIRERLGLLPQDRAVVLVSTWDDICLLERMGRPLVLGLLAAGWRVLLALHPHHRRGDPVGQKWTQFEQEMTGRGVLSAAPGGDNIPLLIASDIAVFDHTSMATMYALLRRPLVFCDTPESRIVSGSTFDQLYRLAPHLHEPEAAPRVLSDALARYPLDELEGVARRINTYPGEASTRVRRAVLDYLHL